MLKFVATSTTGLESVVFNELVRLGYSPHNSDTMVGRTFFEGEFIDLIKTNLWLRTAGKILIVLSEFDVKDNFDVIFEATRSIEWENWATKDSRFYVEARTVRSTITSEPALQKTVKKAIVDRLTKMWNVNELSETGSVFPIEISLLKDKAVITLDTTGRGLHRRGYHTMNVAAPLRETLASALVQLSVWKPGRPLLDPFCGSGTIPIEAAMLGRNIAPGLNRSFISQGWSVIPQNLWEEAKEEARSAILPPLEEKIHGSDINEVSLKCARQHAVAAGVDEDVVFFNRDFQKLEDDREYGCVVCNPPYGERIGSDKELNKLYESMPAVFSKLPTWSHFILTSWLDLEKIFEQKATRRRKLYNSRIECTYYQFLGPKPPCTNASSRISSNPLNEIENDRNYDPRNGNDVSDAHIIPVFNGLDDYAERQIQEFGRCLANCVRRLRRYPSRGITCYRLYDKDLPEVPLAIDIFEGKWLHIAEYERPDGRTAALHKLWLDKLVAKAADVVNVELNNVFLKRRSRQRGESQYEKLSETGRIVRVYENGLTFLCNMTDYLDVGLFLDHRKTREMVRREAGGKRFLNLFCYSGSFTCYAASGGAASTVSVDLSPSYLEWAQANLEENGFTCAPPKQKRSSQNQSANNFFVKSDVIRFLKALPPSSDRSLEDVKAIEATASEIGTLKRRAYYAKQGELRERSKYFKKQGGGSQERGLLPLNPFGITYSDFELCVCDPPTFSNSKSTDYDWDVQQRHVELLRLLATRMKRGGVVFFSNNFRKFKFDEESLNDLYEFREISKRTVPEEFRNKRIHRCWRMVVK